MATRVRIVSVLFLVGSIALVIRLFYWQAIRASELSDQARLQYQSEEKVLAKRGSILASDGTWLATNIDSYLVFISKPDLKEKSRTVANKLAAILVEKKDGESAGDYQKDLLSEASRIEGLIENTKSVWIPIKHKVELNIKRNIEALGIAGVGFDTEPVRFYPEASSSAQVLGFVGKDNAGDDKGYFGLEGYYDLTLSGKPGYINRESNAAGIPILFGNSKEIDPVEGVDLTTHIDKTVQMYAEKELEKGIQDYGAKGGTVIIMDPNDGSVLAMASYPYYDPGKYWEFTSDKFKNPAISDGFEPGSIMKPLVVAAGLDAGAIKVDTICDICDGPVKVDKYEIETWNHEYHPNSSMTDIIVNSDNVGMTFIGRKLGADKLYDYFNKFGFGETTGVDLQGEVSPQIRKKGTWNIVDLATATFGQGVAVTPIQMARAICAVANGGYLVKPQVVEKIGKGDWANEVKQEKGERVISQKTAEEVRDMMIQAIERGESKWAAPKGFKIAGKTGTAQIPVAGHYDDKKTIASFIGFAPANKPRFAMLVTLTEPSSSQWGSETAAPLWFNIARDIFPYLGIQPEN